MINWPDSKFFRLVLAFIIVVIFGVILVLTLRAEHFSEFDTLIGGLVVALTVVVNYYFSSRE